MEQTSQIPFQPVPQPKPRRVGTVTMGLSLVAAGGILLASQFGFLNILEALRWSPVILILLGIEILVGSALNKGGKMRYDFLSMLVCFVMITLSAGCALVPVIFAAERSYTDMHNILSARTEERIAAAVGEENIAGLSVNVWDNAGMDIITGLADEPDISAMADRVAEKGLYECHVYLELTGRYNDHEEFAQKASSLLEEIAPLDLPVDSLTLSGTDPDGSRYELYLDRWGLTLPAEDLALQVQGNIIG